MTYHRTISFMLGFVVLLHSALSLSAADEKTTGCVEGDVPCHLSPRTRLADRKVSFRTTIKGSRKIHAGFVCKRFDEARRTPDRQRRWSSRTGGCRRV